MADPVAHASMMIRRPAEEVFEAFADPATTSRFWFSRGSGRLEPGAKVRWDWEMYGFSVEAEVQAVERNRRLLVAWSGYGYPTPIEWIFTDRGDGTTYVEVTNSGFRGTDEEKEKVALDATEGFTFMLAGAKVWLEHGVEPNFVGDKFPDGLPER